MFDYNPDIPHFKGKSIERGCQASPEMRVLAEVLEEAPLPPDLNMTPVN